MILIALLAVSYGTGNSAPKREAAPAAVKKQVKGSYSIIQMDKEIGTERFTKTIYDNNIMVLEGTVIMAMTGEDSLVETTSMTLEDDSNFLLSYSSSKHAGKFEQKNSIEMFSNLASIRVTTNNEDERTLTRVIPTGALCIQSGIAHQLELLLNRYNDAAGGKQGILVFEPVSKVDKTLLVEFVGEEETTLHGETRKLRLYTVRETQGSALRLYVDDARTLVKVVNQMQRMEFVLAKETG
jgi:hypothetical protein